MKKPIKKNNEFVLLVTGNKDVASKAIEAIGKEQNIKRAKSVDEALNKMAFKIPSIIIADMGLPKKNGIDLLKTIRNSIKTKLIPFVIISPKNLSKDRLKAIENGADAFLAYSYISKELSAIVKSKLNIFKEFYLLSITDELTRLFNRKEFIKKFNEEISNKKNKTVSLSILDIDFFKQVNDMHGHLMGDKVLLSLAEMLKERTSDNFFPARFGGEEFIILFPGLNANQSFVVMERLLSDFSSINFENNKNEFKVTFSAGITEYPTMSTNISELLSRADQALYAAKKDGRNKVYIFSPMMSRNNKFWEYLKTKKGKGYFVDDESRDSVTQLPYLPQLLELISNLDYDLNSIGVLLIRLNPVYKMAKYISSSNFYYDIENIKIVVTKSCESDFPFDVYIGLSDFFNYEFIILFPGVVDFSFDLDKFQDLCLKIGMNINDKLANYCSDISYASDVLTMDRFNPRKIFSDINKIRRREVLLSKKRAKFEDYLEIIHSVDEKFDIKRYIHLKGYYNIKTLKCEYQYFTLKAPFTQTNIFGALLEDSLDNFKLFNIFLNLITREFLDDLKMPLLFPLISPVNLNEYFEEIKSTFQNREVIILINENHLSKITRSDFQSIYNRMPENISFGINNTHIGNDILGFLSLYEFKVLLFSENITRNIHLFKERIKVINGLNIFLDQIAVPPIAKQVRLEEEFQIINDLNFSCVSGSYIEQKVMDSD